MTFQPLRKSLVAAAIVLAGVAGTPALSLAQDASPAAASAAAQAASSDSASAGGASRVRARKRGACFMLTLQKFEVARHECAQAYV